MEGFSHVEVLFVFDRFPEAVDHREPRPYRGRSDLPPVGVFAGRGPRRPNRIGVTCCAIASVHGRELTVVGLDADHMPRSHRDGAFDVLFDAAQELTVLMHGLSRRTPPNSRDGSYHRGFPARPGFDKGHAMAHAQGGREGGPNYFPQAPRVNRRLSPLGGLWRDIQSYLASNPGLYCFVRLAYPPGLTTDIPMEVEYGVGVEGQFRVVVFPSGHRR